MPNNFARTRAGWIKVASGIKLAKKRDIDTTFRVVNKGFASATQEIGSPNGAPGPIYSGGGGSAGSGGIQPAK